MPASVDLIEKELLLPSGREAASDSDPVYPKEALGAFKVRRACARRGFEIACRHLDHDATKRKLRMIKSKGTGRMLSISAFAMLLVASSGAAYAEWLGDVWSDEWVAQHGSPSITVGRAGDVTVVLPLEALERAQAEGATHEGAIRAFLARYAPKMCSHLMNFNEPHKGLRVALSVAAPVARSVPFFVVSPGHEDLTIDYAPETTVHCVVPSEEASS